MAKRRKNKCKFGVNKRTKACLKSRRPRRKK
jgi:hypothetical protein